MGRSPNDAPGSMGLRGMRLRLFTLVVCGLALFVSPSALAQPRTAKVVFDLSPRWNGFDGNVQNMMSAVQGRWNRILVESRTSAPSGTIVAVKFTMDSRGRMTNIVDVGSTSGEPGEQSCVTALTTSAPFGEWTGAMIEALGTSQELTVKFYYF